MDFPLVGGNIWADPAARRQHQREGGDDREAEHDLPLLSQCVRQLTDITTDDEGVANVSLVFPTNLVGAVYGFDMYPEGAPAGNKYQSAQISFR